jgi:hypothetical protein
MTTIISERIDRILKEYKDVFEALENYDKTGKLELPSQRKRTIPVIKENIN